MKRKYLKNLVWWIIIVMFIGVPMLPFIYAKSLHGPIPIEDEIQEARIVAKIEGFDVNKDKKGIDFIVKMLKEGTTFVKIIAARKLGNIEKEFDIGSRAKTALKSISHDIKEEDKVRAMAILSLNKIESRKVSPDKRVETSLKLLGADDKFTKYALRPMYYIENEGILDDSVKKIYRDLEYDEQSAPGIYFTLKHKARKHRQEEIKFLVDVLEKEHLSNPGKCLCAIACLIDIGTPSVDVIINKLSSVKITPENYRSYAFAIQIFKGTADKRGISLLNQIINLQDNGKVLISGWIPFSNLQNEARIAIKWIESEVGYPYKYREIFGWKKLRRLGGE